VRVFGICVSIIGMLVSSYVRMIHFHYVAAGIVTTLVHDRPVQALALKVVSDGTTTHKGSVQADATDTVAEEHYQGSPLAASPASAHFADFSLSCLVALGAGLTVRSFKRVNLLSHRVQTAILFIV
jgi:hypothetical protein